MAMAGDGSADFLKLSELFKAMKYVVRVLAFDHKYKIAILASKQDHCMVDLLHGWQSGRFPVDITRVIRVLSRVRRDVYTIGKIEGKSDIKPYVDESQVHNQDVI
ncbi:hypothetical protein IFM89_022402 [Coptis chinensis]|uniref:Uncharacterized protein n=1 Tax=Coptis chinensis TaxID=261450 RepID=A0A835I722_9MAGN|nr:hypothetical protein IFM89_022402 [Coptis chinensis]